MEKDNIDKTVVVLLWELVLVVLLVLPGIILHPIAAAVVLKIFAHVVVVHVLKGRDARRTIRRNVRAAMGIITKMEINVQNVNLQIVGRGNIERDGLVLVAQVAKQRPCALRDTDHKAVPQLMPFVKRGVRQVLGGPSTTGMGIRSMGITNMHGLIVVPEMETYTVMRCGIIK